MSPRREEEWKLGADLDLLTASKRLSSVPTLSLSTLDPVSATASCKLLSRSSSLSRTEASLTCRFQQNRLRGVGIREYGSRFLARSYATRRG